MNYPGGKGLSYQKFINLMPPHEVFSYDMQGICCNLAIAGFLTLAPIRSSGKGNLVGHEQEIESALAYLQNRLDVDLSRLILMGFSRGAALTLSIGVKRTYLAGLIMLAPAPALPMAVSKMRLDCQANSIRPFYFSLNHKIHPQYWIIIKC